MLWAIVWCFLVSTCSGQATGTTSLGDVESTTTAIAPSPAPSSAPSLAPLAPAPASCAKLAQSLIDDPDVPFPRCVVDGSPNRRCYSADRPPQPRAVMPVNLTVAFYGDQAVGDRQVRLMRRLREEDSVEAFVHAGDFDYNNRPATFENQINEALGPDFPYFVAVGNHDFAAEWPEYSRRMFDRLHRMNASCIGDVGRDMVCSFRGLSLVLSGVGTSSTYDAAYIEPAFARFGGLFRVCVWHKNQRLTQLGGKSDEVGWDAFRACLGAGALIVQGHEHSYARSVEITGYASQPGLSFDATRDGATVQSAIRLAPGSSNAVVCAGTAGISIRACYGELRNNAWWAKTLCAPDFTDAGAMVCKFNLNGDPTLAFCYFKTDRGAILDQFYVRSEVQQMPPPFPCDGQTPPDPLFDEWPPVLDRCADHGCWLAEQNYAEHRQSDPVSWCTCCALGCQASSCGDNPCALPMCAGNPYCPVSGSSTAVPTGAAVASPGPSAAVTAGGGSGPVPSFSQAPATAGISPAEPDDTRQPAMPDRLSADPGFVVFTVIAFIVVLAAVAVGLLYFRRKFQRQRRSNFTRFDEELSEPTEIVLEED